MCNFFAQADALANGKSEMELRSEQVPEYLVPHKTFTGNRPSISLMLPDCTAYTVGQLLALYELRIGVQVSLSILSAYSTMMAFFPHPNRFSYNIKDGVPCIT